MTTPIWCELVCIECASTTSGRHTYGAIPRASMKREATKDGWIFKHDDCFCSAACLRRYEACLEPD